MTTLREAAQQALERLRKYHYGNGFAEDAECIADLEAALAQQAEPVEPVAWIESPHGAIRANPNYKFTFPSQLLQWQIALYIAPPQRKPLTEEEIDKIFNHLCNTVGASCKTMARAVEKAVWEKNHGQA